MELPDLSSLTLATATPGKEARTEPATDAATLTELSDDLKALIFSFLSKPERASKLCTRVELVCRTNKTLCGPEVWAMACVALGAPPDQGRNTQALFRAICAQLTGWRRSGGLQRGTPYYAYTEVLHELHHKTRSPQWLYRLIARARAAVNASDPGPLLEVLNRQLAYQQATTGVVVEPDMFSRSGYWNKIDNELAVAVVRRDVERVRAAIQQGARLNVIVSGLEEDDNDPPDMFLNALEYALSPTTGDVEVARLLLQAMDKKKGRMETQYTFIRGRAAPEMRKMLREVVPGFEEEALLTAINFEDVRMLAELVQDSGLRPNRAVWAFAEPRSVPEWQVRFAPQEFKELPRAAQTWASLLRLLLGDED